MSHYRVYLEIAGDGQCMAHVPKRAEQIAAWREDVGMNLEDEP